MRIHTAAYPIIHSHIYTQSTLNTIRFFKDIHDRGFRAAQVTAEAMPLRFHCRRQNRICPGIRASLFDQDDTAAQKRNAIPANVTEASGLSKSSSSTTCVIRKKFIFQRMTMSERMSDESSRI